MKAITNDKSAQPAELTQQELAMLNHFRTLNDAGRNFLVGMGRQLQQGFSKPRANLRLVAGGAA